MLEQIERALRADCGVAPGDLLVVGISGGPDSTCLLHALHALSQPTLAAHLDHGLRSASPAEAVAVEAFVATLGLEFIGGRVDVAAHAASQGQSIEEAARRLRYEFLITQARLHGASAVAVAHNADDQAETLLMHLLGGTGLAGLTGMRPRTILPTFDASIPVVRPLLGIWREQIVEYCRLNALPTLHDTSNDSPQFLRNRIRNDLLPVLETYNPRVRQALWRAAETSAADLALVEQHVDQHWAAAVMSEGAGYVGFRAEFLAAAPPALAVRLVMRAAASLLPEGRFGFASLQTVPGFVASPGARSLDLGGGLLLYRESAALYVCLGEESLPVDIWPQCVSDVTPLETGRTRTVELNNGWQFSMALGDASPALTEKTIPQNDLFRAGLDADSLPRELVLRVPGPGDRIAPLGMQGHTQKLSDLFVNERIPRRARRRWPVLAAGTSVVWVPGLRISEAHRLRPDSKHAAFLVVSHAG